MDPELLYLDLAQLVAEMPELHGRGVHTPETYRWLGRASHLVKEVGNGSDSMSFDRSCNSLGDGLRGNESRTITAIVFRALAQAEANAPTAIRGAVIVAGATFTAIQVVKKVLAEAKTDALIIDPYIDEKLFVDFAPLAASNILLKILTDPFGKPKGWLNSPLARWTQQYGSERRLDVKTTQPRALHDRLIILDSRLVYSVTQSFKDLAVRSPALLQLIDPDLAALKIAHYGDAWKESSPVP